MPGIYIYDQLPNGFYGWMKYPSMEPVSDPFTIALLYAEGERHWPNYAEGQGKVWESEVAELERIYRL